MERLLEPKLVDNLKKKISRHNRINAHIYELTAIVVACTRFMQAQATKRIPAWRNGGGCKIPSQSEKLLTFDCCEKRKKSISSIEGHLVYRLHSRAGVSCRVKKEMAKGEKREEKGKIDER